MIYILYGVHEMYADFANAHEELATYIHSGNREYIDPANTYARWSCNVVVGLRFWHVIRVHMQTNALQAPARLLSTFAAMSIKREDTKYSK
jgi:hypothetical protein